MVGGLGSDAAIEILRLTWVELAAGWGLLLVSRRGMLWFLFERWRLRGGCHTPKWIF